MNPKDVHILLVDDERDILEILDYNLSKEGFQISTAGNGRDAIANAKKSVPNLIILDLMMPGIDGIETCKKLRKLPALEESIILFLTALGEDESEMAAYHAGADDYITKPVRPKVLVSKVKALLRRINTTTSPVITAGKLTINRETYTVQYGEKDLRFPRKEFELLALLASTPNKVFTREAIMAAVWGDGVVVGDRTIDVHIRKIREKLNDKTLQTVKGVGYKFSL